MTDRCITLRIAGGEIHRHRPGGADIGDARQLRALAVGVADDGVVTAFAFELVVADGATRDMGVAGEARRVERIGKVAADGSFDVDEGICSHARAGRRSGREVDRDAAGCVGIDGAVEARATVEDVVTRAAAEIVLAGAAKEDVVSVTSADAIVAVLAVNQIVACSARKHVIAERAEQGIPDRGQHGTLDLLLEILDIERRELSYRIRVGEIRRSQLLGSRALSDLAGLRQLGDARGPLNAVVRGSNDLDNRRGGRRVDAGGRDDALNRFRRRQIEDGRAGPAQGGRNGACNGCNDRARLHADGRHLGDRALDLDSRRKHRRCGRIAIHRSGHRIVRQQVNGVGGIRGEIDVERGSNGVDGLVHRQRVLVVCRAIDQRNDQCRQRSDDGGALRRPQHTGDLQPRRDIDAADTHERTGAARQRKAAVSPRRRVRLACVKYSVVVGVSKYRRPADIAVDIQRIDLVGTGRHGQRELG